MTPCSAGFGELSTLDLLLVAAPMRQFFARGQIGHGDGGVHLQVRRGGGALAGSDDGFDPLARDGVGLVVANSSVAVDLVNDGFEMGMGRDCKDLYRLATVVPTRAYW